MGVPVVDVWRVALHGIVRGAYLTARSRVFWLSAFIILISALFSAAFRFVLYICDIPLIDISTIQSVFAPLMDNPLAQFTAYVFALDQIGPVADFILGWVLLFAAALPVVTPLVLGAYMVLIFRRSMCNDVSEIASA